MIPLLIMVLPVASGSLEVLLPIVREALLPTGPIVPWLVIVLPDPVTTQGTVCTPLSVMVWFDPLMIGQAAAGATAAPDTTHAATAAEASSPARREAPCGARPRKQDAMLGERAKYADGLAAAGADSAGDAAWYP